MKTVVSFDPSALRMLPPEIGVPARRLIEQFLPLIPQAQMASRLDARMFLE